MDAPSASTGTSLTPHVLRGARFHAARALCAAAASLSVEPPALTATAYRGVRGARDWDQPMPSASAIGLLLRAREQVAFLAPAETAPTPTPTPAPRPAPRMALPLAAGAAA